MMEDYEIDPAWHGFIRLCSMILNDGECNDKAAACLSNRLSDRVSDLMTDQFSAADLQNITKYNAFNYEQYYFLILVLHFHLGELGFI